MTFHQAWEAVLSGGLQFSQVGTAMLDMLEKQKTALGKFQLKMAKHAVAPSEPGARKEVLPISLKAVKEFLNIPEGVRDWVIFICLVLNFQFCSGYSSPKYMIHSEVLSEKQKSLLADHLQPAVERFLEGNPTLPAQDVIEKELKRKGQDYDGSTYVVMEELDAGKVVECWPSASQAAIAPLQDFLEGETLRQVQTPMSSILPPEEWPSDLPKSYVRATDETWAELVKEGYKRGLFQHCPANEILCSPSGRRILNGAGAVPKSKGGQMPQRFISIFCPLNAVSRKIEGDEGTLPYVGQVHLLHIPDECEIVVDSEDMTSAFNLFRMPEGWRGLFVYEKTVPAHCLGLPGDEPSYVALRTVPMGWISAVGVVQAAIRHLAFKIAKLPAQAEIQKWKEIPEADKLLLYLDSVDQLRLVSKTMLAVHENEASEEHKRFKKACEERGLPTNAAKTLSGSLVGSLQGGELRSRAGVFMLQLEKMRMNVAMILSLLSKEQWDGQAASGVIGRLVFAAAFRRPILSALEDVFLQFKNRKGTQKPTSRVIDEMTCMVGLVPMAFTSVRAPIYRKLSATDASPSGAGSCTATQLKRQRGLPNPQVVWCANCRSDVSEAIGNGEDLECPFGCGSRVCSLHCFQDHRDCCECNEKALPLFSERWSGANCPLSKAMLREGFDVAMPYDQKMAPEMEFFSEEGKAIWQGLDESPIEVEHHAPDCKTMSRARGRPFWIGNKRFDGPPALRDERNVMGFPNLRGENAVRVRQANKMALKSVARCAALDDEGKCFSLEHPWRSFIWYMRQTVNLASRPGVSMSVYSSCCFGGARQKWTAVLTNSPAIFEALHTPDCLHDAADYQPYRDVDGTVVYPTEEEAEYPLAMAQAYAQGLRRHFEATGLWPDEEAFRVQSIAKELTKYSRFTDEELKLKVAQHIFQLEKNLTAGKEAQALYDLLKNGHYRGTDIRLFVEHNSARELVPYPAYRWLWRDTLSFRWKQESHINELEGQALVAHVRRLLREQEVASVRVMVVVDSQVLFYAVGKGRSPAKRINRLLKRLMALQLVADLYVFPVWTLSAWNSADLPSRRAWYVAPICWAETSVPPQLSKSLAPFLSMDGWGRDTHAIQTFWAGWDFGCIPGTSMVGWF